MQFLLVKRRSKHCFACSDMENVERIYFMYELYCNTQATVKCKYKKADIEKLKEYNTYWTDE